MFSQFFSTSYSRVKNREGERERERGEENGNKGGRRVEDMSNETEISELQFVWNKNNWKCEFKSLTRMIK